ncbi:cytochrome bc complex cytochrome b subunit [Sulfurisphaera ohwakuensis]|uniref:cytochrome b n=1 Tax=Sulfurisphaera ohwakuensis TaxID=69656 RepID=UPI0036F33D18
MIRITHIKYHLIRLVLQGDRVEEERQSWLDKVFQWLDERVGIYGHTIAKAPRYAYRLDYWLGSMVLAAFTLAVITGALVALYYVPSDPYASTVYLITKVPYGALLFSIHTWAAYAMIFLLIIHMTRNFIVGAYRKPREIMWIVGVILAGLALTEAYLGYSLPYNLISWTATTTGLNLFTYMPFNLAALIKLMTTVPTNLPGIASGVDPLVDRFFIFHWIVGGLILLFIMIHLAIFEKHGGPTPPPSKEPGPELIEHFRDKIDNDPNWRLQPYTRTFGMILMTFFLVFGAVILIASLIPYNIAITGGGLKYTMPEYNPVLAAQTPPIPDWYFLFIYFFYKSVPPQDASIIFLAWILITLLFPFIDQYIFRHKASHPVMRPAAIALGTGFIISFIVNSIWAYRTPGVDIGPIGVEVDGLIFLASFVVLYPLIKFYLAPRSIKGDSSGGSFNFGKSMSLRTKTLNLQQQKLILRSSEIAFIGLVSSFVYVTSQLFASMQLAYLTVQFGVGFLLGLDLLLLAGILGFLIFGGK